MASVASQNTEKQGLECKEIETDESKGEKKTIEEHSRPLHYFPVEKQHGVVSNITRRESKQYKHNTRRSLMVLIISTKQLQAETRKPE